MLRFALGLAQSAHLLAIRRTDAGQVAARHPRRRAERRGFHDRLAGTEVVYARRPEHTGSAAWREL
jgi:hypothetical protein